MKYTLDSVCAIVENYTLLRETIQEFKETKREGTGAVLAWAAEQYIKAEKARDFLNTIPEGVQERLKIRELEEELRGFANSNVAF